MADDDSGSIDSVAHTVIENAKAQLASWSTGMNLVLAELQVVASHAGLILCLLMILAGMVAIGWILMLVLGALLLIKLGMSNIIVVLCLIVLNTLVIVCIGLYIRHALNHLSFKHTRKAFEPEASELGYTQQMKPSAK